MESRPVFRNLSPLDHRYYDANHEAFSALADYLSEDGLVRYCTRVEAALLAEHLDRSKTLDNEAKAAIDALEERVTAEAVYEQERVTHHNIRALVRVIKMHVPAHAAALVHVGATSVDILDTAQSLRIRDAVRVVVLPRLIRLERLLISLARDNAETIQVGRTHGQHGVPITFGYAIAEYVSRLGKSIEEISRRTGELRGKLAGAVGAYNSLSLLSEDPIGFERSVLARLDIEPSEHSTQLVEPEHLLRLLVEINVGFGVIANLADDLRNLQRTEIDELRELFTSTQVGSSTMPQKRNPWNSEHVKSLWKAFSPRVQTFFLDQISEHQRDLTNSASGRFVVEFIAGFLAAVERMTKVVSTLRVDAEQMRKNVMLTGELVLAEAAYTLLATTGRADAHEDLRTATLASQERGVGLVEVLRESPDLWEALSTALSSLGQSPEAFFADPVHYTGRSAERARALADDYENRMHTLEET
jgi:adenylosuccinate lyase